MRRCRHGPAQSIVSASVTRTDDALISFGGFNLFSGEVFADLYLLKLQSQDPHQLQLQLLHQQQQNQHKHRGHQHQQNQNRKHRKPPLAWQRFDSTTGGDASSTWPSARYDHTATFWPDMNCIVLFGGCDSNDFFLNDVHILRLDSMRWERPRVSGYMPLGRKKHSAVISDGKLYVHGGWRGNEIACDELNVLDLKTLAWSNPITITPRSGHTACIFNSTMYIYGGMSATMDRATEIIAIDLSSLYTHPSSHQNSSRFHHSFPNGFLSRRGSSSEASSVLLSEAPTIINANAMPEPDGPPQRASHHSRTRRQQPTDLETRISLFGASCPPPLGQHFAGLSGSRLVVLVAPSIGKNDFDHSPCYPVGGGEKTSELMGLWSLDLSGGFRWMRHRGVSDVVDDRNVVERGSWHYFAMDDQRIFVLGVGEFIEDDDDCDEDVDGAENMARVGPAVDVNGGNASAADGAMAIADDDEDEDFDNADVDIAESNTVNPFDEYMGNIYEIDFGAHGIVSVPPTTIQSDFAHLLPSLGARSGGVGGSSSTGGASPCNVEDLTDFEIIAADPIHPNRLTSHRVHRLVLQARWPHFAAMCRSGMSENLGRITLPERAATVTAFIHFLYTDTLPTQVQAVDDDDVTVKGEEDISRVHADLMVLATVYFMDRLQRLCAASLHRNLSVTSSAWTFARAAKVADLGLRDRALDLIMARFGAVARSDGFRELMARGMGELDPLWDALPIDARLVTSPAAPVGVGGGIDGGRGVLNVAEADPGAFRNDMMDSETDAEVDDD